MSKKLHMFIFLRKIQIDTSDVNGVVLIDCFEGGREQTGENKNVNGECNEGVIIFLC